MHGETVKNCAFLFHEIKYKFYNPLYCGSSELKSVIQEVIAGDYYYYYYYYIR